jgi:hypothetical protein
MDSGTTKNITMTIDGILASNSKKLQNLDQYSLCDVCDKYYTNDLIDTTDNTFIKCVHCHFFLKYEDFTSKEMTDLEKTDLSNYVNAYANKHNSKECTKKSDMGGCFLCEYSEGVIPDCKLSIPSNSTKTKNDENTEDTKDIIRFSNGMDGKHSAISKLKSGQKFVLTV